MNRAQRREQALQLTLDMASMRRRTVAGASTTAVAQLLKFCLQVGSQIVLARLLDPAQFGLVAMVAPVLGLVIALNDAGLGQAIVQRADLSHAQVSAMVWINVAIGVGLTAFAMLAAPLVAHLYDEPRVQWIMVASSSLIVLTSLSVAPLALLNRQMRFPALAAIEVGSTACGLAVGVVAACLGADYWSLVVMQAVNSVLTAVTAWLACGWWPSRPRREPGVGALMRFGANVAGSNIASYISVSADQMIVGAVNGKVALGLYDRSFNLVNRPLGQLMAPVGRVAVPLLSRLQDAPDRYARSYLLMLQLINFACLPGLIAIAVAAEAIIPLLLGPKWLAMAPVFSWVATGATATALASSTYWLFTSQNRTAEQMRWAGMSAVLSIAAFAIGSIWGVVGVARLAALTFMFVQTPLMAWAATRRGPVSLQSLQKNMLPIVAAAAVAALATRGWMQLTQNAGDRWWPVLGALGVSYLSFAATLLAQPAGRRSAANARAMLVPQPASGAWTASS